MDEIKDKPINNQLENGGREGKPPLNLFTTSDSNNKLTIGVSIAGIVGGVFSIVMAIYGISQFVSSTQEIGKLLSIYKEQSDIEMKNINAQYGKIDSQFQTVNRKLEKYDCDEKRLLQIESFLANSRMQYKAETCQ